QQERLGSAASGRVYALFPRGLEWAGPGSADAHLEHDELAVYPNEPLTIVDRKPAGETEWMLAEKADGTRGLIPRSHISCYPLVRVPPASMPVPVPTARSRRYEFWDEDDDVDGDEVEETEPVESAEDNTSPHLVVEVEMPRTDSPNLTTTSDPVAVPPISRPTLTPSIATIVPSNEHSEADADSFLSESSVGGTEVVASVSITLVSFVSDLGLGSSCGIPPDDVVEFKAAEEAGDPGNVINE
ncbi:SH3 domain protein, partial [Opisthorchis viverrini]